MGQQHQGSSLPPAEPYGGSLSSQQKAVGASIPLEVNFLRYFGGIIKRVFMARVKNEHPTPKENLIRKIGGKLESDYLTLRAAVDEMNGKYFNLLYYFDLVRFDDAQNAIIALTGGERGIARYFIERISQDYKEGKVKKEKVLKSKWIVDENTPPEEREKRLKKENTELHRSLALKSQQIIKEYRKNHYLDLYGIDDYYKRIIILCKDILNLTDHGAEIDVEKFIAFYTDRMKASSSVIGKQHIEAAEALNRFFGGAVPITQKELERYFVFEGIVKVKQSSVNLESYSRLGSRIVSVNKISDGKSNKTKQ